MSNTTYRKGEEPIPGYPLQQYLGRGGFGEVWRATGPGGVSVAMKIIHDLDRKRGGKELRALRLLKNIRHPNLVPLTGFWLRRRNGELISDEAELVAADAPATRPDAPGANRGTLLPAAAESPAVIALHEEVVELIIAMGLCEKSLFDRLGDCKSDGLQGIPQDELLTYMEDAARAIDLLNSKHGIQHCDVKPQNILLLSGAAQVCDFGLATAIGDVRESSMGAGTIAYGAPEVLLGKGPSAATDQYSLAISYFELRTGELPFGSERISDILRAKQHGEVDLSLLPAGERSAIAVAAAIDPRQRFANCAELVRALRKSSSRDLSSALVSTSVVRPALAETPRGRRESAGATSSSRRSPYRLAGISAGGLALIALCAAWLGQDVRPPHEAPLSTRPAKSTPALEASAVPPVRQSAAPLALTGPSYSPSDRSANTAPATTQSPAEDDRSAALVKSAQATAENTQRIAEAAQNAVDNTHQIAEVARQTAENTAQIAEATRTISTSIEALREAWTRTADRGGLVENPDRPSDYYHNARLLEQRGDHLGARRQYARFLAYQLNAVDPHLRFQRLLRIQDGAAAARETYAGMLELQSDLATQFAATLLEPDGVRTEKLRRFVAEHKDYAPAVYELSREYSAERLGAQGLGDRQEEKKLLKQFMQLAEDGRLLSHFLDPSEATRMIEDSRARLAAVEKFDSATFENPVRLTSMQSNSSWTLTLLIAEAAREIRYRKEGQEEFQSTGFNPFVDQRTGSPAPKPFFELPLGTPAVRFQVKYTDIRGNERGPFEIAFNPDSERFQNGRNLLEQFPHGWISFRDHNGQMLAYFTHLVSYRYAITEVRYSVDSHELDRVFALGPSDPNNPHAIPPGTQTHVPLPSAARFVAVRLTYRDGSRSETRQFDVRPPGVPASNASAATSSSRSDPSAGEVTRSSPAGAATATNDRPSREVASEPTSPDPRRGTPGRRSPIRGAVPQVLNGVGVEVTIDPSMRRPPRVNPRLGF